MFTSVPGKPVHRLQSTSPESFIIHRKERKRLSIVLLPNQGKMEKSERERRKWYMFITIGVTKLKRWHRNLGQEQGSGFTDIKREEMLSLEYDVIWGMSSYMPPDINNKISLSLYLNHHVASSIHGDLDPSSD